MYRLIAVSKTNHGTTYYAVVNREYGSTDAIIKARDKFCFEIIFIEKIPSAITQIVDFVRSAEERGML